MNIIYNSILIHLPQYLLEKHGVFEKRSSISMRLVVRLSYLCNDKEGNDRLSWPRFNTSVYEEKVRARNAKSRANFSILHSQTPPADRFVPTSMIESWRSIFASFEMDFSFKNEFDLIKEKIRLILCNFCT